MSDTEPTQEDTYETEAAIAELGREFDRVGVNPEVVSNAFSSMLKRNTACLRNPADRDEVTIGIDVFSTLRIIRALPDNAGTNAFLAAFGLPGESAS